MSETRHKRPQDREVGRRGQKPRKTDVFDAKICDFSSRFCRTSRRISRSSSAKNWLAYAKEDPQANNNAPVTVPLGSETPIIRFKDKSAADLLTPEPRLQDSFPWNIRPATAKNYISCAMAYLQDNKSAPVTVPLGSEEYTSSNSPDKCQRRPQGHCKCPLLAVKLSTLVFGQNRG